MYHHLRPKALLKSLTNPISAALVPSAFLRTATVRQTYATQSDLGRGAGTTSSRPTRKTISVLSDDGRIGWSDLSGKEKAARATQQTFNFAVVLVGAVLTGGVAYLLYTEVFSPNSRTWQFEKAVERIKNDSRCTDQLGDRRQIKAYGENTWSRWARNRPIATTIERDQTGREHLRMNFHVEGPLNSGVVFVHMIKPADRYEWEYQLLALDVKGHSRIYLERAPDKAAAAKSVKIFGIQWR